MNRFKYAEILPGVRRNNFIIIFLIYFVFTILIAYGGPTDSIYLGFNVSITPINVSTNTTTIIDILYEVTHMCNHSSKCDQYSAFSFYQTYNKTLFSKLNKNDVTVVEGNPTEKKIDNYGVYFHISQLSRNSNTFKLNVKLRINNTTMKSTGKQRILYLIDYKNGIYNDNVEIIPIIGNYTDDISLNVYENQTNLTKYGAVNSNTSTDNASGTSTDNASGTSTDNASGTSTGNASGTSTGNESGTSTGNESGTSTGNESGTSTGNESGNSTTLLPYCIISLILFPILLKLYSHILFKYFSLPLASCVVTSFDYVFFTILFITPVIIFIFSIDLFNYLFTLGVVVSLLSGFSNFSKCDDYTDLKKIIIFACFYFIVMCCIKSFVLKQTLNDPILKLLLLPLAVYLICFLVKTSKTSKK